MGGCGGTNPPRLGLALGSGSIRGLAHIGVLRALSRAGVRPEVIVGSSAGALVGALFCIGCDLAVLESFASSISWRQLADFGARGGGLVRGDKVHALLRILTRNLRFEDCRLDFSAVATDLCTGERVVLKSGSLADAIRASISIPGIFAPFELDGRILVDGGLVGRLPISVVRERGGERVIAVDVVAGPRVMSRPVSIFEVILQSMDILEAEVVRASLGYADIVISPEISMVGPLDLSKTRDIVAAGESAAEAAMPQISALLGGHPGEG